MIDVKKAMKKTYKEIHSLSWLKSGFMSIKFSDEYPTLTSPRQLVRTFNVPHLVLSNNGEL